MAKVDKKIIPDKTAKPNFGLFSSSPKKIQATHTEELVIALCGPIGSPIPNVSKIIKQLLESRFDYKCNIIKLSKIIEKYASPEKYESSFDRIKKLIAQGDKLRLDNANSILADLAIFDIASDRETEMKSSKEAVFTSRRVCHIVDSIKNQEELEALKLVYRDMLYFIGVFSPLSTRIENLKEQGIPLPKIYELIDQDSGEEFDYGQTVRNTFPLADFFLRVDSDSEPPIKLKLERFFDIIFGIEIYTPTFGETAMHLAASASGNSACLSRQVGAALTDKHGKLISVGWNDVPKSGGNLYQYSHDDDPLSKEDKRCMHMLGGQCFNDSEKNKISNDILSELTKENLIDTANRSDIAKILNSSKIGDLIEFSRAIHAEMHAIIIGSQSSGERVIDGKLYCTTYPCHSCARHIIAAGINEVYYIEPYRKSLAVRLHKDDITEDETDKNKVRILLFDGIAPSCYSKLFKMKTDSRKNSVGKRPVVNPKKAFPIYEVTLESLPALEKIVLENLQKSILFKDLGESHEK